MLTVLTSVAGVAAMQEADYADAGFGIFGCLMFLIWLAVMVTVIAGFFKVFTKAGQPGWAAIVPIYNVIVLLQIVRRPLWWIVLMLIPLVNVVVVIIVLIDLARVFGKGVGFAIGLLLLPFIFFLILGFGDARYQG